jgi:ABC-2 type transport system ATP-binding protein
MTDTPENLKHTIGKGDILEMEISLNNKEDIDRIRTGIESLQLGIVIQDEFYIVQGKDLIGKIPEISLVIQKAKDKILKMTLRENTLEDVFIHLTGRMLRS